MERRRILTAAVSMVGACAGYFSSIPLVKSLLPSARARALGDPIEVDLAPLRPGQVKAYQYRGRTILILRRTDSMLDSLRAMSSRVLDADGLDPSYVANEHRSIQPEFLVVEGVCTHLACVPQVKDAQQGQQEAGEWWQGGFLCPCHGSGFDYAGRVVKGPAPANLAIPPHRYVDETRIVIGEDPLPT